MTIFTRCLALSVVVGLSGCQATGDQYEADVFDASQVNTQQEAKTVKIITVSPTRIKVSNEKNQKAAMMVGGVLGAIGGAALGNQNNTDTAIVGGVAGGAAGAMAGSLVNDSTLVPGVLIGYSEDGKIFTSAQVGRPCQFQVGQISLMVMTLSNETRIQPNGSCPEPVKG